MAVECRSPLLQKSLEMFLSNYLSSIKQCDILVRDIKCVDDERCFYVSQDESSDLMKPFSKSQLVLALESRYKIFDKKVKSQNACTTIDDTLDFTILEKRIDILTQEYKENILKAVKAFYEK